MMSAKFPLFAVPKTNAYQVVYATMAKNKVLISVTLTLNVSHVVVTSFSAAISLIVFKNVMLIVIVILGAALLIFVQLQHYVRAGKVMEITVIWGVNA